MDLSTKTTEIKNVDYGAPIVISATDPMPLDVKSGQLCYIKREGMLSPELCIFTGKEWIKFEETKCPTCGHPLTTINPLPISKEAQ